MSNTGYRGIRRADRTAPPTRRTPPLLQCAVVPNQEAQQVRAKTGAADGEGSSSMHVSRALHPDAYEQAADETLLAAAALCAVRDA